MKYRLGNWSGSISALLIVFALTSAETAVAAEHMLEPASPWQVDNERAICRLSRDYGQGKQRVSVRFEQFGPGGRGHVVLTGKLFMRAETGRNLAVRFGSSTESFEVQTLRITLPDRQQALLLTRLNLPERSDASARPQLDMVAVKNIDEISFTAAPMGTVRLQTKSLSNAMGEMEKCADRLVRSWGFDPEQQALLSHLPSPIGETSEWIRSRDFPIREAMRGQSSVITYRLRIEADGTISSCDVPRAYTIENFGQLTCRLLLSRAKFSPAIDARGQPIASYWLHQVVWRAHAVGVAI